MDFKTERSISIMDVSRKSYWNEKFKQRGDMLLDPEPFLAKNLHRLKKGTVLDFACGDGRNAMYLAANGFEVTGVDFSPEALIRLQNFAHINHVAVATIEMDLTDGSSLSGLGAFDNILINHYKPAAPVLSLLPEHLKPGGILMVCGFNYRQSVEKGFPRDFCFEEDELTGFSQDMDLLLHDVFSDQRAHLDGYIFQKKCI